MAARHDLPRDHDCTIWALASPRWYREHLSSQGIFASRRTLGHDGGVTLSVFAFL